MLRLFEPQQVKVHTVSFSNVPKLSEDLLATIFAFYCKSQIAIKKKQLNSLRIASVCGRVLATIRAEAHATSAWDQAPHWGKKEKKIGERSEQRGSQERGTWWRKLMFRKIRVKGALIS